MKKPDARGKRAQHRGSTPVDPSVRALLGSPPPCTNRKACRAWKRAISPACALLWVYIRARWRGRSRRKCVLATWVAREVWANKPRESDRGEWDKAQARFARWREMARECPGPGGRPDFKRVERMFAEEFGPEAAVETWEWAPRRAKECITRLSDDEVGDVDGLLFQAFMSFHRSPDDPLQWAWCRGAQKRVDEARVLAAMPGRPVDSGQVVRGSVAEILANTSWYQIEVSRGHAPRTWFCWGCDQWHAYGKGRPTKYHAAFLSMALEVAKAGGLGRGDLKRLRHVLGEKIEVPGKRRMEQYVKKHHLGAGVSCRTRAIRTRGGSYRLVRQVVRLKRRAK